MRPKCKSTSHQSTSHRQPVTGQPVTGQQVNGQPVTGQPVTSQPGTGQCFNGQPGIGQPVTGHPVTGHSVITRHWAFSHQAPVIGHQSIHQALVITHQSPDNDYLIANKTHRSSEQSLPNETQNSSTSKRAGLGGSVGCAVRLEIRRSRVQPPPRSATFFHGDWSWNIFYGHSLPSADSRRAVVSFWRKNVHSTG